MNIVMLCPLSPFPPIGGWALAIYQDVLGLAGLGHQLHIVAVSDSDSPPPKTLQQYGSTDFVVRRKAHRIWRVVNNLRQPYPFIISHFDIDELVDRATEYITRNKTDIILAHDICLSTAAYKIRERTGVPVYLRLHNVLTQILSRFGDEQKNPLLRQVARWQTRKSVRFEQQTINQADGVSAVSQSDDQALIDLLPALTRPRDIIGFGANLDALPCRLDARDANIIMHLGSLMQFTKLEGMQWFCREVWPSIRRSHPSAVLELAGHTPESAFTGIDGVRRLGIVDDPLPALHRGRVFIAPQFVGSGMRLKLLNAMATGNAVVCTRVACEGIPILDGQHGLVRDDAEGFANAVLQLLTDPALATHLGQHARELVETHFDYRRVAEHLSQCMQRTIA